MTMLSDPSTKEAPRPIRVTLPSISILLGTKVITAAPRDH